MYHTGQSKFTVPKLDHYFITQRHCVARALGCRSHPSLSSPMTVTEFGRKTTREREVLRHRDHRSHHHQSENHFFPQNERTNANGGEIRTGQTGFPIGLLFGRVNHVACLLFQSCLLFHYLSHERLDWIFGTPPHPLCFGNGYSTNRLWGTHLSKRKPSLYPTLPYKQHQIYPKQH